jgi:hypothetical protein
MHTISYVLVVIVALIFLYTGYYGCDCYKKSSVEGFEDSNTISQFNEVEKVMNSNVNKIQTIQTQNKDLLNKMNNDTKAMLKTLENM